MGKLKKVIVAKEYLLPFVLITFLFALWGFANDITNPMVAAFGTLMEISTAKAALVQLAFYGGYATMAVPAALFVRKYTYKKGILLGLILNVTGAFLFYPAAHFQEFSYFLISLYILTFGLAFLETTANPYILSMGDSETATRRLNLAQAFNPFGSLLGMFVASSFILSNLQSEQKDASGNLIYTTLDMDEKIAIKTHDLVIIRFTKMPALGQTTKQEDTTASFKRLLKNSSYREGVLAQMFYVGAQIMCWTFIIQYAERLGLSKAQAQNYNILAMAIFLSSRFISTFLMKYINYKKLLGLFGLGAVISILGVIFIQGMFGLYSLIFTSAFMSLMFPTIYGIALENLGDDTSLGAAGLVMAIVGGALMPPIQGLIIDLGRVGPLPAVNASFILPLFCFIVVAIYGYRTFKTLHHSIS